MMQERWIIQCNTLYDTLFHSPYNMQSFLSHNDGIIVYVTIEKKQ